MKSTGKFSASIADLKAKVSQNIESGKKETEAPAPPPSQAVIASAKPSPKDEASVPQQPAIKPSLEAIQHCLKEFAQQLKAENVAAFVIPLFESSPIRWIGENEVCVTFENPILENHFRDQHKRAEKLILQKLNYAIALTHEIADIQQEKKLYTDAEKMDFLLKKYPAFSALKDSLGLDIDN